MAFKPFKPPGLKSLNQHVTRDTTNDPNEPSSKRRKLSPPDDDTSERAGLNSIPIQSRQPLKGLPNPPDTDDHKTSRSNNKRYYSILWRKFTLKKNKTWDDDGVASFFEGQVLVFNSSGKCVGTKSSLLAPEVGSIISLGAKEVQIEDEITKKEFTAIVKHEGDKTFSHDDTESSVQADTKPVNGSGVLRSQSSLQDKMKALIQREKKTPKPPPPQITMMAQSGRSAFKQPLKENTVLPQTPSEIPIPRHDPHAAGAIVFKRPRTIPPGKQIVDVVLDPLLGNKLRQHQKDGIKFLYECVMNFRDFGGQGCILADDMGLGKTLQTIALIWTLVKQNPIYKAEPVVKKALIVCPVTLVQNWKKEFRKWLGRDRIGVMAFDDKGSRLSMFDGKNFKVMIVGYERLRTIAEDLTRGAGIDIIICDEGHRLKTLQNKSAKAIETLNTAKRIILSGTPIQNDLSEFFAMANFVNDGVLGSYKSFVKDFEKPIMTSRQPFATDDDIERGEAASDELANMTSPFILRRTVDILSKFLPVKTEYVLFCNPTPEQASIYRQVLKSPMFQSALGSSETALQLITILKKLCNSPALMKPIPKNDESLNSNSLQTLNEMLPGGISRLYHNSYSSKIRLLDELLHQIQSTTDDKVVLVSHYTTTLDLMENLLVNSTRTYRRLDGTVPHGKRQGLIDEFNRTSSAACFAFLLSAKAGGAGINLFGANRLVLFDVDWNPATDDQAMARIYREGQKKPCKIYRFLIKGGLEEKIWQRQVVKRGLASSILEGGTGASSLPNAIVKGKGKAAFSREELQNLFSLDEAPGLRTHDLIKCSCSGSGCDNGSVLTTKTSSPTTDVHDIDDLDSGSDEDLPDMHTIIKASQLTDKHFINQERKAKADEKTQELMLYSHIDTSRVSKRHEVHTDEHLQDESVAQIEAAIDDACLLHVLTEDKDVITGNIAYIFKKTLKPESLDETEVVEVVEDEKKLFIRSEQLAFE